MNSQTLQKVDHSALKTNQLLIITLNILAFILNLPILAVFVTLVMGIGSASRVTTNEAYQCPNESRVMRTLDGSDGSARDHTTGTLTPLGSTNRPSRIRNPRRVYSSDGRVFLRALNRGRPRPGAVNDASSGSPSCRRCRG